MFIKCMVVIATIVCLQGCSSLSAENQKGAAQMAGATVGYYTFAASDKDADKFGSPQGFAGGLLGMWLGKYLYTKQLAQTQKP